MNKRSDRTDQTRQKIVDAFWELYEERRIDRITVKEVVAKAGCHRSTFYVYFNSVYEILESIENSIYDRIIEDKHMVPEELSSEEMFAYQLENFKDDGPYLSVLLSERGDPSFAQRIKELLAERMRTSVNSKLSDEHVAYITEFSPAGFSSILTKWIKEGHAFPIEELMLVNHMFKEFEIRLLKGEIPLSASALPKRERDRSDA